MSSSSSSYGSSSNNDDFISSLSFRKILEDMDQDDIMIFQMMPMACKSDDLSLHMKWKKREWAGGGGPLVIKSSLDHPTMVNMGILNYMCKKIVIFIFICYNT
jgi:hypothetical protein